MSNKKTKKANVKSKLPETVLTPVQKIEKVLIENGVSIGVQAVHKQAWRRKLVEFIANKLGVQVVPFVYTTKKQEVK